MGVENLINGFEIIYFKIGYLLVFLSAFIEISPFGWTIPGGIIVAGGGFYSYSGEISLIIVLLAGWFGSWLTFLGAYFLGNKTGLWLVKTLRQEKNASRSKILLKKHGGVILTTSMMANLTRFWVAYVAGHQNYHLVKFVFYSGVASLTWTSLMVSVGYLAGSSREQLETGIAHLGILGWIFLFIALGIIYLKTKQEYELIEEKDK